MGRSKVSGPLAGAYIDINLAVDGTLVTVTGGGSRYVLPYDIKVKSIQGSLHSTGAGSGSVGFNVSDGTDSILTSALTIAYNDSDKAAFTTTLANDEFSRGDVLQTNVTQAPGNGASDLKVVITAIPTGFTDNEPV